MYRILIVEDEPRLASFIEKGLRQNGFSTQTVGDGAQALEWVRSHPFDLMILDLGLPNVDGWDVLEAMPRLGLAQPVIVVTAGTDTRDAVLQAGASDYLAKPFRFQALLDAVETQLS